MCTLALRSILWASKQPLELPQYTLVHCNIQMWGSHGYNWAVSQRKGYREHTEKTGSTIFFKGYCLQIWIDVNILNQLCIVLSTAWTALCAFHKNGCIFIYWSYLIVTWGFVLSRLQTRISAPSPFSVKTRLSVTHKMFSTVCLHISLKEKGNSPTYSNWRPQVGH